jgi:hypothetical protein
VHEGTFDELLQALLHDISIMLCKQKRKRRTSLELIEDHAEFMEHFLQDETAPLAKTA